MQKLVVNVMTGEQELVDLTPEEIAALPEPQEPLPVSYPTSTVIADRTTGEPYEVFVENGVLTSEPLAD